MRLLTTKIHPKPQYTCLDLGYNSHSIDSTASCVLTVISLSNSKRKPGKPLLLAACLVTVRTFSPQQCYCNRQLHFYNLCHTISLSSLEQSNNKLRYATWLATELPLYVGRIYYDHNGANVSCLYGIMLNSRKQLISQSLMGLKLTSFSLAFDLA